MSWDTFKIWIFILGSFWAVEAAKKKIQTALMPYPCSHFYFDINFGDRLYSKEKRPGSPILFWISSVAKFDIKVKVTTWIGHKDANFKASLQGQKKKSLKKTKQNPSVHIEKLHNMKLHKMAIFS